NPRPYRPILVAFEYFNCFESSRMTSKRPYSLTAPYARAAVDRQCHAGNETRFIGREKQRGVGDVPAGAPLLAQRNLAVALGLDLGAGLLEFARAGVDRHRRVHQPGQDDVGADAILRV